MRTLTATLLAAQKAASAIPVFKATVSDRVAGVKRLSFSRLYTGAEPESFHALTFPADGALVRGRTVAGPPTGIAIQRTPNPGPGSDFSIWQSYIYSGLRTDAPIAACSRGQEIIFFLSDTFNNIILFTSTDNGANWTWGSAGNFGGPITSLGADFKSNGDIALFFTIGAMLYVKKRTSGSWSAPVGWPAYSYSSFHGLGVNTVSDVFHLIIAGTDTNSYQILTSTTYDWSLWQSPVTISKSPPGVSIEFSYPSLACPDIWRFFYVDTFTGSPAASRLHQHYLARGFTFNAGYWREAIPFNFTSPYGLAADSAGGYAWLSHPKGVWRAETNAGSLDLTQDIVAAREEVTPWSAHLDIYLTNDRGRYNSPGSGALALLTHSAEVAPLTGYRTTSGEETSPLPLYYIKALEHISAPGQALLRIHAVGAAHLLEQWVARQAWRFNDPYLGVDKSVWNIIQWVLARAGLGSQTVSASPMAIGLRPGFAILHGENGLAAVRRLLSFLPDVLYFPDTVGSLKYPQSSEAAAYSYGGSGHPLLEGVYMQQARPVNFVQAGSRKDDVSADSFSWPELESDYERYRGIEDLNLSSASSAQDRGAAILRQAEMAASQGHITVPVNCGQEMYDVIEITDPRAGLSAARRRVTGLSLRYEPQKAIYQHRITLGGV